MLKQLLLWLMLILPWLSLVTVKLSSIKRYMPVVLLSSLLVTIVHELAYSQGWWRNLEGIVPWGNITNVSMVYGMFAIGTFWIFYFTYGSFWMFVLTNVVIDGLWLIFAMPYMEQFQILLFTNISRLSVFFMSIAVSLILYVYQIWQEGVFRSEVTNPNTPVLKSLLEKVFSRKEGAR